MKNYKNYLIALLTGLLVLSLSTQPSQGAGTSKEAKIVQYTVCLNKATDSYVTMDMLSIPACRKYQP